MPRKKIPDFPPGFDRLSFATEIDQIFDAAPARASERARKALTHENAQAWAFWANATTLAHEIWIQEYLPDATTAAQMLLGAIDAVIESQANYLPVIGEDGFVQQWLRVLATVLEQAPPSTPDAAVALLGVVVRKPKTQDVARAAAVRLLLTADDSSRQAASLLAASLLSAAVEGNVEQALPEWRRYVPQQADELARALGGTSKKRKKAVVEHAEDLAGATERLAASAERAARSTGVVTDAVVTAAQGADRAFDAVQRTAERIRRAFGGDR